jgi:hypothetical protein
MAMTRHSLMLQTEEVKEGTLDTHLLAQAVVAARIQAEALLDDRMMSYFLDIVAQHSLMEADHHMVARPCQAININISQQPNRRLKPSTTPNTLLEHIRYHNRRNTFHRLTQLHSPTTPLHIKLLEPSTLRQARAKLMVLDNPIGTPPFLRHCRKCHSNQHSNITTSPPTMLHHFQTESYHSILPMSHKIKAIT